MVDHNLGVLLRRLGKHDRAVELHEQVLKSSKAKLGPMHPKTLTFMAALALAYESSKKPDRALPIAEDLVTKTRIAKGDKSPEMATALSILGGCLLTVNRAAEAEKHFREALQIRTATTPEKWTVSGDKSRLGMALTRQKKFSEAEPLLLAGYEGLIQRKAKIPYTDYDEIPAAIDRLVEFYTASGKPEKADEWRKKKTTKD
jgi:tetratricopeptide (TPR) repeat protein